jgi:ABC-type transport system involved in multi-copper enzyme maturation permease subunit
MGIIVTAAVVGIFRAGSVFIVSNFGLVFFMTLLYLYAGFLFAMMISTFFTSAKVANVAFFIFFLLLGLLYLICKIPVLAGKGEEMNVAVFWILSIFPQVAYALAVDQVRVNPIIIIKPYECGF